MYKKIILFVSIILLPVSAFAVSATITYFSPSTTVAVNSEVFFRVNAVGFPGTITYTVSDTLPGSSVSSSNMNSSTGNFVWNPRIQDVGTHTITITLSDSVGNSTSVSQQITVPVVPTVVIQNLYPSATVNVGQTVFFSSFASGFTNPTFSASDSIYTSSMTASNMNASGGFSWTPREYDVGAHTITVVANDSSGHSASVTQSITVAMATTTISLLSPGNTVTSRQNVSFKVTPTNFTNPIYTITDSVSGSTINSGNINGLGVFSWTPSTSDIGTHLITVRVSDSSGNVSNISQQITVTNPIMTIQSLIPGNTIGVGGTLSFTATTTGLINSQFSVTDSLGGSSISNSNIATTGVFSWIPKANDIGLHTIRILASDNYGSIANAETIITVTAQTNPPSAGSGQSPSTPPTSSSNHVFNKYLGPGSSGVDVTALQTKLKQLGFLNADITGYYGNLTTQAVKSFQASKNLEQVGSIGPMTRTELNNLNSSTPTIPNTVLPVTPTSPTATVNPTTPTTNTSKYTFTKPLTVGNEGTEVMELQKKLTSMGLYSGPITGYFGPMTRTAIIALQAQNGLEQVGSIGPGTRAILNSK